MNKEELAEKLRLARESYYNLEPIMSDSEYDEQKEELRALDPSHFEVKTIGAAVPKDSAWEKVRHEIPMGSLDKVYNFDELNEWVSKTKGATNFTITHKIDGASLELVYESGKLVRGVTRGDGEIGEDITSNIRLIPNIPETLSTPIDAVVRGEVVMLRSVFEDKYAETYANPRNTVSPKMRERKNGGADCSNMSFIAYWILCEDRPKFYIHVFKMLKSLGFEIPNAVSGPVELIKEVFRGVSENRKDVEYDIDGMVVSVSDLELLDSLGESDMCPRGQRAWKFESEKAVSKMLDVVWQVGLTGRCCPVAKIEPVKIGGVTVRSISVHNLKMFNELKLWKGCRVLVERRGDVIPYLSANLDI